VSTANRPPERARAAGAGTILRLVREGRASTRVEIGELTGLARSTVTQRVDQLLAEELLLPAGDAASTGGRPSRRLAFNRSAGVVLAADLGATHSRLALCDLGGEILDETMADRAIADGPDAVLGWVEERFDALLERAGRDRGAVRAIGVGVPGPVEFATGRPVTPPIMPGWDGYPVADRLGDRYAVPVLVDNDVNIMALGEHWAGWRDVDHLLLVKVGTGIGCGIVAGGRIHRGAQGAAGDLGHIQITSDPAVVCRCGNIGCMEAVAGGGAIAASLRAQGVEARDGRDVVALVRSGSPAAVREVREAGRVLGSVLATSVNLFNPAVIVIGGDLSHAEEHLLAGVREIVYQRSLPLATRSLRIVRSRLDDRAGVVGASVMAIEHVLAPDAVDDALSGRGVAAG
jgi:predicted NBD/HSP70 family sugar kinase